MYGLLGHNTESVFEDSHLLYIDMLFYVGVYC